MSIILGPYHRAFESLRDLRDAKHDPHDEVVNEIKSLLEAVISQTVPLPRDATEKDYYSKMIDYVALYKICSAVINLKQYSRSILQEDLFLNWSDPLEGR